METKALNKIALSPLFSEAYKTVVNAGREATPMAVQSAERARLYRAVSKGMRARNFARLQRTTRDLALPGAGLATLGLTSYAVNS